MGHFIAKDVFYDGRNYHHGGDEMELVDSELEYIRGKGQTHHLLPADPEAKQQLEGTPQEEKSPEEPDFQTMTVAQLRAYAEEKGIDISAATNKATIIEAILAAQA